MFLPEAHGTALTGSRIVFVFHGSEQGGAEHQGLLLAAQLKERYGVFIAVLGLAATQSGRVARRCLDLDIPWHAVPFSWPGDWRGRVRSLYRFNLVLKELQPDIILPYTYLPNVVCSLVWRFAGARLCVWNQRDEGRCLDRNIWHRLAIGLAPCRVSNSTIGKDFLEQEFGLRNGAVHVVPNAVAVLKPKLVRSVWRTAHGLSSTAFVAAMVANLHHYKDHVTLLEAWRIFLDKRLDRRDLPVLLLAGRFDGAETELRDFVTVHALQDSVRFLGEVDDVASLLAATDIYLHSSRFEGLPNAVLEAMSMSLPVVATDIPGIREAVGPSGLAYLSRISDSRHLADLIEQFYDNAELRDKVGAMLHAWVTQRHDLRRMVDASTAIMARAIRR